VSGVRRRLVPAIRQAGGGGPPDGARPHKRVELMPTITVSMSPEQYYALQEAADETAADHPAREAMAVIAAAWEASQVPGDAVRFHAVQEPPDGGPPRITVMVKAEVSGEWVEPALIAGTIRQLADTLAARLRASAAEAPGQDQM